MRTAQSTTPAPHSTSKVVPARILDTFRATGLIVDVRPTDLILYRTMIELGGGILRRVQRGDSRLGLSALILFDDTSGVHHSTLALNPRDISSRRVRMELEKKRAEFHVYAAKATERVTNHLERRCTSLVAA